ncbi:MAG: O-antigen ligase family protein [Gammaproteobacteria bacterium]|nr:O-antigen ligase family protein [Gammaproteobacteria bacterium]MBU1483030.1 O-antigen ligase family protein [Gammaproteobacteria bacterium]
MPEYIRVLIVILVLATTVFAFAHRSACAISDGSDYKRRRNVWITLTLAAFLTQNFWLYALVATLLLLYSNKRETNPTALYFFILFVIPEIAAPLSGLGLINNLFDLTNPRLLALVILLPAFLSLQKQSDTLSFARTASDKALIAYLFLVAVLYLREDNLTNVLRKEFYLFIDVFLPYYVVSRALKDMQSFRDALLSLVIAMMILAMTGIFEFSKGWVLYSGLTELYEQGEGLSAYLGRDGMLRALATSGQPIVLGYLMVIGIGSYFFIQRLIHKKLIRRLGWALLAGGLIAPLSRGPWVGCAVMLVVYTATGRYAVRRLTMLALAAVAALALVSVLPGGERVINLIPFVGKTEKNNVEYREQLFTNSMIVIQRNPWVGSTDYLNTPEMEAMRQGQGIIDIVNSYVVVALKTGFIGLGLFAGFFAMCLFGIHRAMRSIANKDSEEYLLGRILMSTLLAMLVIISTVSSITFVPIMYWCIAGMGVAYAQLVRKQAEGRSKNDAQKGTQQSSPHTSPK